MNLKNKQIIEARYQTIYLRLHLYERFRKGEATETQSRLVVA